MDDFTQKFGTFLPPPSSPTDDLARLMFATYESYRYVGFNKKQAFRLTLECYRVASRQPST